MNEIMPGTKAIFMGSLVLTAVLGLAAASIPTGPDDVAPCRIIGDKVNPRFSALWVTEEGMWVGDDLNHSILLYDRKSGKVKRQIHGLQTGLDFVAAVQVDPQFKLPDGRQGLVWASMNDTSDRAVAYPLHLDDKAAAKKGDVEPAFSIDFDQLRLGGERIYRGARVYGFYADAENDEIALGLEKKEYVHSGDGHSSLGSIVIVDRGGSDPSLLGRAKRWIHGPHTGLANPHGVWIDAQHNEIYVANYGHLPQRSPQLPSITIYDRLANGDATPKRVLQGPRTHLGMPIKIFLDGKNNELFVVDDQEGILVFNRLASGDVAPKRIIASHGMPNGLFVDLAQNELVVANWESRTIEFFPRTWNPHNHHPHAKRTIAINPDVPVVGIGNPGAIAFAREELIVPNCVSHSGFAVYERTANGAVSPKRHVEGNKTQMSRSIHGLSVWQHPADPSQDEVFIPKPLGSAILVFNRTDNGNVPPKRVIQGPATQLDEPEALAVDEKEIGVPNGDHTILIFPRLGNGNIAPIRRIRYQAGRKDPATGAWLGPWGEGSSIRLGSSIWFDDRGTADPDDDEIVVRARYIVRDPGGGRTTLQNVIVFFPKNSDGPTIPKRIIASKALTGVHQVTVLGNEVFNAVQGVRATYPPEVGGLAVFDARETSTLNPDGRTLSDISPKRFLRAGDIQGGVSGVKHPRSVAVDPVRGEVYLGDSKGNDIRVFRVNWQTEQCLSAESHPQAPKKDEMQHQH